MDVASVKVETRLDLEYGKAPLVIETEKIDEALLFWQRFRVKVDGVVRNAHPNE